MDLAVDLAWDLAVQLMLLPHLDQLLVVRHQVEAVGEFVKISQMIGFSFETFGKKSWTTKRS